MIAIKDEPLEERYRALEPLYERLGENLKRSLQHCFNEAKIHYLHIDKRIKTFSSFCDKAQRKGYSNPLEQTDDICGLRIICYYPSDVELIGNIITAELEVKDSSNKPLPIEPDRFGYRSLHFIASPQTGWLREPNYRGLGGLRAEIQVRTLLMHAWAEIEHKLAYKKQEHIPPPFRRKFSQLSALLELSDEQFEFLRREKELYQNSLKQDNGDVELNAGMPTTLNLDSLQAFLDSLLSDRPRSEMETGGLLEELLACGITLDMILDSYNKTRMVLPEIERAIFPPDAYDDKWAQVGVIRAILELTHDTYWDERRRYMSARTGEIIRQFREQMKAVHG